jgi:predicted negative regulator of RcsB-dependent stress response
MLREHAGHEVTCASVNGVMGAAIALTGDLDRGRAMAAMSVVVEREAGMLVMAAAGSMGRAHIEVVAGDLDAAERLLRDGLEELDRLGDRAYYATVGLVLADVLRRRGEYDEAATWCRIARETTGSDDVVNILAVDALEGYLLARSGDVEDGERLIRRAVELAATVDFFWIRALVFRLLGETLALAGNVAEATAAFEKSLHIYETKGDAASAAQIRELMADVSI